MISRIKTSGFKSLNNFSLDLTPGLNILVGPNGSGKTNIVSLFEFISYLMETDASEATSKSGGAGAVFRRVGDNFERQINIEIMGCAPIPTDNIPNSKRSEPLKLFVAYAYNLSLEFPEARDAVVFTSQELKIRRTKDFITTEEVETTKPSDWSFQISVEPDSSGAPKAKINRFDARFVKKHFFFGEELKRNSELTARLERYITTNLSDNISLVSALSRMGPDFWIICTDMSGGQVYNVVPSKIKLIEDSAKPPGIARDGSGLAATLYAMERSRHSRERDDWFYFGPAYKKREFPADALVQLKDYLRLVNDSISNIKVDNDSFENQLRVRFEIKCGDYEGSIPLTLMSDGTLKWIAILAAALTSKSVFSIEEPENYLHPQMQAQIVRILREILFQSSSYKFTLMTTHSETLLNHCKPNEIILVSFSQGSTIANRCTNTDDINREIQETGFGLGYYYINNTLQNE